MKTKTTFVLFMLAFLLYSCNQSGQKKELLTLNSLQTSITGEITANAKYLAYAGQARQDSLFEIAALFSASAIAEKAHADRQITMLLTLNGSFSKFDPQYPAGTVNDNLMDAIKVENYEAEDMYPGFIVIAREEGLSDITETYEWALKAEVKHRRLFNMALASLDDPSIKLPRAYMVCPRCGNTMDAEHYSSPCDICQNDASKFTEVK